MLLLGPPVAISEISRTLDTILTVVNTDKAKRFDHSGCHRKASGQELHPLESSAFRGALLSQLTLLKPLLLGQ